MDVSEFIKKLETEFEDIPKGYLTPSIKMSDIEGWSSMHSLIVVALADTEYGVTLKGDELKKAQSIQELFDVIKSKSAKQ
jgi:acyl carrier protein